MENQDFVQEIIREGEWEIVVICPVCGDELNIRERAYWNENIGKEGAYVHQECLS